VRHGETVGNSSIRFYGKTDVPLNNEGIEQMTAVYKVLENEIFVSVFTSPLIRTIEGAYIILGNRNLNICKVENFREIDFGRWEGLTLKEIEELDPSMFCEWRKAFWKFDYPQGDRREDFIKRVKNGIDMVLNMVKEGTVLLVLHKGVIRTSIFYLLGKVDNYRGEDFFAELGSIHEIHRINGIWHLTRENYTEHLVPPSKQ